MAQLIIATAGAAIGSLIPGVGTAVGWAIGSVIGAQFEPKQQIRGPRLDDLKVTGAEYGQPIPWIAGHPRIAGQLWWSSDRREIATTTSTGKGGGGAEQTAYTYECDVLCGLCDREIDGIRRIWLNGKLAWTRHADADADSLAASQQDAPWSRLTVYTGASDQLPDPTYEAAVANAPAYRGRGSVFIEGLQLGNSGVIPNLTFEVVVDGTTAGAKTKLQTYFADNESTDVSVYQHGDGTIVTTGNGAGVTISGESFNFYAQGTPTPGGYLGWVGIAELASDGGPITVEWFSTLRSNKNVAYTVSVRYISNDALPGSFTWAFGYYGSPTVIHVFNGSNLSNVNINQRTHHAFVIGVSERRYYIDGVLRYSTALPPPASGPLSGSLRLGADGYNNSEIDDYSIDSFRVRFDEVYTSDFTPPDELDPPDGGAIVPIPGTLQTVVEELCERAGLPAGTYDASALAAITKPVYAIAVAQVTPARAVLEQLMAAYYFEAYCTDKLYFVPRAGSSAATLTADDMGCGIDAPEPDVLPMQVGSDEEVPSQVAVNYANLDADYNTATEFSDRLLSGQVNTAPAQLPLAFTSAEAKGIADAMLVDGYASRVSGRLALPVAYARLVPTDVVTAPAADGTLYRVRLVRRTDSTPLLEYEWVLDDASAVVSAGITSTDYTPTVSVALPGSTVMALLDCPLLRDSEDQLGHYVAATSRGTTWPGASINRSIDDVEYAEAARVSERAVIGTATSVLANWTGGVVFDEKNTVTVDVQTTLSSSTRDAMLADLTVNAMMIGDELVRYRTATLVSTGIYTLSGLLRGQRGTEWATGTHAAGETVVRLSTDGLRYVPIDTGSLAVERWYKGVTIGRTLASVSSTSFTCNGVSSKPLAPVDIRRTVSLTNSITLAWKRRTRLESTFTGAAGSVVPLGEETELYSIDVVVAAVVVRTLSATSSSCTYTAAQQTADGVNAATTIRFDVYQISATVGRGYAGSLVTTGAATPLPQIATLTVGGTFATGAALYATIGGVTYGHTSVGGDTDLDGIADSLAAVIDASSAYAATAVGAQITVTAAAGIAWPISVGVRAGDNTTRWALTQAASDTVAATANSVSFRFQCQPGANPAYPYGTVFSVSFQRIEYGQAPITLPLSWLDSGTTPTDASVLPIIAQAFLSSFRAKQWAEAYGLDLVIEDLETGLMRAFLPLDEPTQWGVVGSATNLGFGQVIRPPIDFLTYNSSGTQAAAARPQIVTLTLAGTPVTGRVYRATLAGVNYDYTAGGGDTTMALVAAGLASVIDAAVDFIASAVGAVITITHASNNVPFTYAATVVASTVTLTAVITQEAA